MNSRRITSTGCVHFINYGELVINYLKHPHVKLMREHIGFCSSQNIHYLVGQTIKLSPNYVQIRTFHQNKVLNLTLHYTPAL